MRVITIALLLHILFSGCSSQKEELVGSWIVSTGTNEEDIQGIRLAPNGEAYAIRLDDIKLDSWQKKNHNQLILKGESGSMNRPFLDTLYIERIKADSLVLKYKDQIYTYIRYR